MCGYARQAGSVLCVVMSHLFIFLVWQERWRERGSKSVRERERDLGVNGVWVLLPLFLLLQQCALFSNGCHLAKGLHPCGKEPISSCHGL